VRNGAGPGVKPGIAEGSWSGDCRPLLLLLLMLAHLLAIGREGLHGEGEKEAVAAAAAAAAAAVVDT